MSSLQIVLLLLSVAVLHREGSSGSPLSFLRDIKNRIFTSKNSTTSTEQSPTSCSQEGVCILQNTTAIVNAAEVYPNNETGTNDVSVTEGLDNNSVLTGQFDGNATTIEDMYNTNYTQDYEEQVWNSTTSNNTENYRNDFEYVDIGQNGTNYSEAANINETNYQTEEERRKRDVSGISINIRIAQEVSTTTPVTLNTTVLTSNIENSIVNVELNQTYNSPEDSTRVTVNDLGQVSDESNTNLVKASGANNTLSPTVMADNKTEENKDDYQVVNDVTKMTFDSSHNLVLANSNETVDEFMDLLNSTEATTVSCSVNNITCLTLSEQNNGTSNLNATDTVENYKNESNFNKLNIISNHSELISSFNKALKDFENFTTSEIVQSNAKDLQDVPGNSTQIIKEIVENLATGTVITPGNSNINTTTPKNIKIEDNETMKNYKNISSTAMQRNDTEIMDNIGTQNSTIDLKNSIYENNTELTELINENSSFGLLNETLNTETSSELSNSNVADSLGPSPNGSTLLENNTLQSTGVNDSAKVRITPDNSTTGSRHKRSFTLTIGVDDDYEEEVIQYSTTPVITNKISIEELSYNVTLNSTEAESWNETTEAVNVFGPVCFKRYEQCVNSSDCCENYKCITTEENNSTYYCDLRSLNSSIPSPLQNNANNEDSHPQSNR